jgi:hypothetical protein
MTLIVDNYDSQVYKISTGQACKPVADLKVYQCGDIFKNYFGNKLSIKIKHL